MKLGFELRIDIIAVKISEIMRKSKILGKDLSRSFLENCKKTSLKRV
jgi:hypothetical protein